jgi:serine/threonine protein kinase/tetratricopeptide (TPR) repeat protein
MAQMAGTSASPGTILGHFRIIEKIGSGGMGQVFRAHDDQLDRDVALKILPVGMLNDESARKRFRKEALALGKLNHPNIETVYEFTSQGGVDFLAMELVPGTTLGERLKGGPLADSDVVSVGSQITEALAAAHDRGILHRDLKPGNIMVMPNGHVKVLDFGLAKFLHLETDALPTESLTENQIAGTLPYMAPEQIRGDHVDVRSDIYGAGAVLYEMATGRRPFAETSPVSLIDAILHREPPRPTAINQHVSTHLENVILRALSRDPESRHQTALELAADLTGLSVSQTHGVQKKTVSGRKSLRVGLGPVAVAAAALCVLIFVLLAIPAVRHVVFRSHDEVPSAITGVPPLSAGRYLAVLPLATIENPQSSDMAAAGLSEELIRKLSQFRRLHLASEADVANVSANDSVEKTARHLGVNLIVDGLVQGSSDKVSIIVNLRVVPDGKKLWSQQFSGLSTDLLALEDQISDQLVTALDLNPTNEELARSSAHPTESVAAYDLYLRGRGALRGQHGLRENQAAAGFAVQKDLTETIAAYDLYLRDRTKNGQTAAALFAQAVQRDPNFVLAYSGLADASLAIYMSKQDEFWSASALAAALRGRDINDDEPKVHFSLAAVYRSTGKNAEAISELKRALKLEPNSDDGYRALGALYISTYQATEAIETYKKAIEINPYFWMNYNALGTAYSQVGDLNKAQAAFLKVSALDPNNSAGFNNAGLILLQQGKYAESIPVFQKAIALTANDDSAYSNLGYAYFELKRYDDAVTNFGKAVELNPTDSIEMGNLADAYRWSGQKDKANYTYDKAIELAYKDLQASPRSATALASLAVYYAKKGESTQALNFIGRALYLSKDNVDIMYNKAQVEALANRPDDALKALRQALRKGHSFKEAKNDPELGSLQSRPEFAELEREFAKPLDGAPTETESKPEAGLDNPQLRALVSKVTAHQPQAPGAH